MLKLPSILLSATAAIAVVGIASQSAMAETNQPNILVIMADDVGWASLGSYHQGCRHIAQFLARNGYVVAAVDFPLSYMRSPAGSPQLLDVANQPGDVSAIKYLGYLLLWSSLIAGFLWVLWWVF